MEYDPDFKKFVTSLYIAFPSLRQWVQDNSPNMADTHKRWHQTLKEFSLEECMKVLDDWTTGKKEPFKAYEKDMIALVVRSCVNYDRDQKRRDERNLTATRDHLANVHKSRNAYSQSITLAEIWAEAEVAIKKSLDGDMSEEEWQSEVNRISSIGGPRANPVAIPKQEPSQFLSQINEMLGEEAEVD